MVKTLSSQVNSEFLLGLQSSYWFHFLVVFFFRRITNGKQLWFSQNCKGSSHGTHEGDKYMGWGLFT